MVQEEIESAVKRILSAIGEDIHREGLQDTPARVARMYQEIFKGRNENPASFLETQFLADGHEDIVIVKDISFYSMCEHHLLPFFGKAHVAYLPDGGRLAGLSKLARVTRSVASRPQLQERLSSQIADTIFTALTPRGVMVVVEAEHMCMAMRGVHAENSSTITLVSRGILTSNASLRAETLQLLRG
jgi:GTP cyclohydrolase I